MHRKTREREGEGEDGDRGWSVECGVCLRMKGERDVGSGGFG